MYLAADALSARRGPAMSRGDDSVIGDRATEGEAWLKIDTATARVFCVSALVMLAAAIAGWYLLLSVLGELNMRLDKLQTQRLTQLDEYRAAILGLESKLEAVAIKLQRVEALTQPNNWDADARSAPPASRARNRTIPAPERRRTRAAEHSKSMTHVVHRPSFLPGGAR
jgi:hypothetical protein